MGKETRKLPDGTLTTDPNHYGDAWCALGEGLVEVLGEGWVFTGCNPNLVVAPTWKNRQGETIRGQQMTFPVDLAYRLIAIYRDAKEFKGV